MADAALQLFLGDLRTKHTFQWKRDITVSDMTPASTEMHNNGIQTAVCGDKYSINWQYHVFQIIACKK